MSVRGSRSVDLTSRRGRRRTFRDYLFSKARQFNERFSATWKHKLEEVLVPLPEPVRAGWERFWIIRPDVNKSPEAKLIRKLLVVVQKVEESHRKDFARRDWRSGKKLPVPHELKELSERDFLALEPKLQNFFNMDIRRLKYGTSPVKVVRVFVCSKPWMFVSKTRPYYYTHRLIPDGDAATEHKFLERHMYGPSEYLMGERYRYHGSHFDHCYRPEDGHFIEEDPDEGDQ